jgi:hypothetical protein
LVGKLAERLPQVLNPEPYPENKVVIPFSFNRLACVEGSFTEAVIRYSGPAIPNISWFDGENQ